MITGIVQPSEQLEKPRRLSNLAVSIGIIVLDWLAPNDFQRGAIAVPESLKERLGRRRASYDPLRSPPPEWVDHAEGGEVDGREGRRSTGGEVGKGGRVGVEEVR